MTLSVNIVFSALSTGPSGLLELLQGFYGKPLDATVLESAQTCFGPLSSVLEEEGADHRKLLLAFIDFKELITKNHSAARHRLMGIAKALSLFDSEGYQRILGEALGNGSGRVVLLRRPVASRAKPAEPRPSVETSSDFDRLPFPYAAEVLRYKRGNVATVNEVRIQKFLRAPSEQIMNELMWEARRGCNGELDELIILAEREEMARRAVERIWKSCPEIFKTHHFGAVYYLLIRHNYFADLFRNLSLEEPALALSAMIYAMGVFPWHGKEFYENLDRLYATFHEEHVHDLVKIARNNDWAAKSLLKVSREFPLEQITAIFSPKAVRRMMRMAPHHAALDEALGVLEEKLTDSKARALLGAYFEEEPD
ncbi:MAG: hypothetical protein Q8P84_09590 [Deltaproteobacteria bacterium]|nr:hypothetical protein [Deltaproteobacteria bacterium]